MNILSSRGGQRDGQTVPSPMHKSRSSIAERDKNCNMTSLKIALLSII